jgi:hypothetical protein
VIVVFVALEGREEDEDALRDLRCVLEAEFGHRLANPSLFVMGVLKKRRRNARHLEERVYQCLLRSASLSSWLRNCASKGSRACSARNANRPIPVFHGFTWMYDLVAKDAEDHL